MICILAARLHSNLATHNLATHALPTLPRRIIWRSSLSVRRPCVRARDPASTGKTRPAAGVASEKSVSGPPGPSSHAREGAPRRGRTRTSTPWICNPCRVYIPIH
jgi:hypothetical protein